MDAALLVIERQEMNLYIENPEGEEYQPSIQWCIVYDSTTKRILFIQRIVSTSVNDVKSQADLASLALENASMYFARNRLAVLHPEDDSVDPSLVDSIDPESMTLRLSTERLSDLPR
jgi:hypothetical protein